MVPMCLGIPSAESVLIILQLLFMFSFFNIMNDYLQGQVIQTSKALH
jgi:hypothetical protein